MKRDTPYTTRISRCQCGVAVEFYSVSPAKRIKSKVHQKEEHYADTRHYC
jgi:hypothetical protein